MGSYKHYSMGRRNLQCKDHWEDLDCESFRVVKPTVFCFGGNTSTKPRNANTVCKIAQNLVGLRNPIMENEFATSNDVDFIGISYGLSTPQNRNTSCLTNEERLEFVNNIFMPMCFDEDGEQLPEKEIMNNFNRVTFFSHCHGEGEVSCLVAKTFKEMVKRGIDEYIAFGAIQQLFSVTYAPIRESACPSLQIIPMKDQIIIGGPAYAETSNRFLYERFVSRGYKGKGTVAFREDDFAVSVLVSDMTTNVSNEHGLYMAERDDKWKYVEESKYGDEVSQVMANALAGAVASSIQNETSDTYIPKPSLDQVLEETQSILAQTQNDDFKFTIDQIIREKELAMAEKSQQDEVAEIIQQDNSSNITPIVDNDNVQ